jgi:phage-related protein
MYKQIAFYETISGNRPVERFLLKLSKPQRAEVFAVFDKVQKDSSLPAKLFCKMVNTDDLWEIRVKVQGAIFRFLCFFDGGQLIVAAHGFQKKTQKTPKQDIDTATKRKRDYFKRKGQR